MAKEHLGRRSRRDQSIIPLGQWLRRLTQWAVAGLAETGLAKTGLPKTGLPRTGLPETGWVGRRQRQPLMTPYTRFESAADIAIAARSGIVIDANRATVDDWLRLPGLSIHQARTLVTLTQSGIFFYCLEDVAAALGIPLPTLKIWEPIVRFYHYDDQSHVTPVPINPNLATPEQLAQIPGISPSLAHQIVQQRQAFGPYRNFAHFHQRLRLPTPLASQLMHYLVI